MTKQELTHNLAAKANLSVGGAERALTEFINIVTETIARGERVTISGFGTFNLGTRAARHGVNPQTGADIQIPEMKMPRFRAGTVLKARVRQ